MIRNMSGENCISDLILILIIETIYNTIIFYNTNYTCGINMFSLSAICTRTYTRNVFY